MKKKKLLIDLSMQKHPYCGLGQVAMNYGNYFKEHYKALQENYELYLLLPKNKFGAFGSEVKYVNSHFLRKFFSFLNPRVDVWHSIHQCAYFKPFGKHATYILTIHDYNFMYEKTPKKAQKYLRKVQREIDRAQSIVAISTFTKTEVERFSDLKGKQVEVISNGVEFLDVQKAQCPAVCAKNEKPFFFTIGLVRVKKNFHTLLDCMKLFPEKQLYIAGEATSNYAQNIQKRIENENITNVKLLGIISNEERIWLYKNCEAFLFPSLFEGFGLPVIEAMQCGKPVFSSQETSLKEIGGDYAYFWDNFEPQHMKAVIDSNLQAFQNNTELQEKTIAYAHSFSYEKHFEKYRELYKSYL